MRPNTLAIIQLDKQLNTVKGAANLTRPIYGWIKTIRSALGMTSQQFAKRLGITQSRASAIERSEIEDSLTIKTLRESAEALNCKLVYFLIPEKTLEEIVQEQAIKFIKSESKSVVHSMGLENQNVQSDDCDVFIKTRVGDVLAKAVNKIWDVE
ncbi:MAG: mobile mystery protein A [Holosporales bacterium]|jgi:predicted DNA-binding mobile mystery protein A|nr:mobile mystery protein A [Holosporales bacterium]